MGRGRPLRRGARHLRQQILFVLVWKYLDEARISFFQALPMSSVPSPLFLFWLQVVTPLMGPVALLHPDMMVTPHLLWLYLHPMAPTTSHTFRSSLMQPQPHSSSLPPLVSLLPPLHAVFTHL